MYIDERNLSGLGAWYDGLSFDRHLVAEWARGRDSSLPANDEDVLTAIARTPAQGGGFVAGGQRMCLSNRPGGPTEPLRAESQPCPAGSGGIAGEQVKEITAAELREMLTAQRKSGATRVTGRVADYNGVAIAGARVSVGSASVVTGTDGSFSIDAAALAPGFYDLVVESAAYGLQTKPGVRVTTRVTTNVGTVVLTAAPLTDEAGDRDYKSGPQTPWYKNKWIWIGGGVVLVGGVAAVVVSRRRRNRG